MVPGVENSGTARLALTVGVGGSILIALGSTSVEASHAGRWSWGPVEALSETLPAVAFRVSLVLGIFMLIAAWWLMRPREGRLGISPRVALLLWSAPLLLVPPVLSSDPFAYADAGWIAHKGGNPYVLGAGSLGGPYVPFVDPIWRGESMGWPPLALIAAKSAGGLFSFDPYWGMIGQRLVALVGVALMAFFVPKVSEALGAPDGFAGWMSLTNPIVIIHFVGGAHADALAVGLAVVAIWLCLRASGWPGFLAAALVVGVAMGFKQYVGLSVVAVAGLPVRSVLEGLPRVRAVVLLGARSALASLVAVTTFVGTSYLTGFGLGWSAQVSQWYNVIGTDYPRGSLVTLTPSFVLGDALTSGAGVFGTETLWFYQVTVVVCVLLGLATLLTLFVWFSRQPLRFVGWGGLVVALSAQQLHPWYLGFGLAILGLAESSERAARALFYGVSGYVVAYLTVGRPRLAAFMLVACVLLAWAVHRVYGKDGRLQRLTERDESALAPQ